MKFKSIGLVILCAFTNAESSIRAQAPTPLEGNKRIVFLGDSITYSGQYITDIETFLRIKYPRMECEFLNLGLPSETVSGLSEPGHAGGQFPRPVLRERLDRVLDQLKPDLVVACYGMNDGMYYPFSDDRFLKYQEGIRHLRERAEASGARVLHLTPPVFDAVPIKRRTLPVGLAEYPQPFEGYDRVLDRYAGWLLAQRPAGWDVVDLHGPMTIFLNHARMANPDFRLAGDGVHIDSTGHWLIARQLLLHWGIDASDLPDKVSLEEILKPIAGGDEIFKQVQTRQEILRDSWLSATGHKRPGIKAGRPLQEAQEQSVRSEQTIRQRLDQIR